MYLLDTCITSGADEEGPQGDALRQRIRDEWDQVYISPIVIEERVQGIIDSIKRMPTAAPIWQYDELTKLIARLAAYKTAPYDEKAHEEYLKLRPRVKRGNAGPGTNDCRIAAVALARGLIVVTRNTRHFERIPGLTIEDWAAVSPDDIPPPDWAIGRVDQL